MLAVVRRSQKFSPRRRPPSRGRRTAKIYIIITIWCKPLTSDDLNKITSCTWFVRKDNRILVDESSQHFLGTRYSSFEALCYMKICTRCNNVLSYGRRAVKTSILSPWLYQGCPLGQLRQGLSIRLPEKPQRGKVLAQISNNHELWNMLSDCRSGQGSFDALWRRQTGWTLSRPHHIPSLFPKHFQIPRFFPGRWLPWIAQSGADLSTFSKLLAKSRNSAGSSGEKKPLAISSMHCFSSMFLS